MIVPRQMPVIDTTAGKIGIVGSASALTLPAVDGANYILGELQEGIIHTAQWPAGVEGQGRVYTYRHPNCDYLIVWARLENTKHATIGTFEVTAGTGTTQTVQIFESDQDVWIAAPWHAADSGWKTVTYESTDVDIKGCAIWGLLRTELSPTTDLCADRADSYAMAGLDAGYYVVHTSHAKNVDGLAAAVIDAKEYGLRHAVTWCCCSSGLDVTPGAGVAANPFGFTFKHRARRFKSGDTDRRYRVKARTWHSGAGGGDTYIWTITSGVNSKTTADLSGTSAAKDETVITSLLVDCTADDDLEFELTPSGAATCWVSDLSIVEYDDQSEIPTALYEYYGDDIGDSAAADRFDWAPLDDISAAKKLDWADGDGTTPATGPSLTTVGTITAAKSTQWRLEDATAITCSQYASGACRYTGSTAVDPDADDDIVVIALIRPYLDPSSFNSYYTNRAGGATGYTLGSYLGQILWNEVVGGITQGRALVADYDQRCWALLVAVKNRGTGTATLYVNGNAADTANTVAGTGLASGSYATIGAFDSGGNYSMDSDLARVLVYHGNDIADTCDATWVASLAEHVLGLLPDVGTAGSTYSRTTSAVYYPTGDPDVRLHLCGRNLPPCGNSEGYGPDEEIVNLADKNYAFVTGDDSLTSTYETGTHASFTTVVSIADDSTNLAAHGLRELGPNAMQIVARVDMIGGGS